MLKETDILYQNGKAWILRDTFKGQRAYTVMREKLTHSESDSTYGQYDIALARCNYLATRG
jgi:hypothetical protein